MLSPWVLPLIIGLLVLILVVFLIWRFGNRYLYIRVRPMAVDEETFLGEAAFPQALYAAPSGETLYSPFTLASDCFEQILSVDVARDPHYKTIELHVFKEPPGAIVLLQTRAGQINLYRRPGLPLAPRLHHLNEEHPYYATDLDYQFNLTDSGLQAQIHLTDRQGRSIDVEIESHSGPDRTYDFLIPAGVDGSQQPHFFPLLYARKLAFLKPGQSEITITIDGENRRPARLLRPIHGRFAYRTQYISEPVAGILNPPQNSSLAPIQVKGPGEYRQDHLILTVIENNDHLEIAAIKCDEDPRHSLQLRFSPPLPDLLRLAATPQLIGRFSVSVDDQTGVIAGEYTLQRWANEVKISLNPTEGWQPNPGRLWAPTYRWDARLIFHVSGPPTLDGKWTRHK